MTLPILDYRTQIIDAVNGHTVTIIKAETGSGKSTQVPQYLMQCADTVVVTQPRRLAVISIAERVAQEMNTTVGEFVGYRVSDETKVSERTQLTFCTDGFEATLQTLAQKIPRGILVIDEVHEWNIHIEIIIGLVRRHISQGATFKIVIMSATIDTAPLAAYFGDTAVIEVPGKSFPVQERTSKLSIVHEAAQHLREGKSVLVFQNDKLTIARTILALQKLGLNAQISPLHRDVSIHEQNECLKASTVPKCVVATDIAQTSVTFSDIDVVIDSGVAWKEEAVDGVEGLYKRPVSLSDRQQRKGRAGRTKPGIYIDMCPVPHSKRPMSDKPAVLRLPLDKVQLQLACIGLDIKTFPFFHTPSPEQLEQSRATLLMLGCIDADGGLTEIGRRVAGVPESARWGRVLVEGERRGVLMEVITLVACLAMGGITIDRDAVGFEPDKEKVEPWSDAFKELVAFEVAENAPASSLERYGINPNAYFRAMHHRDRLLRFFQNGDETPPKSTGTITDMVCALYTGFADHLYKRSVLGDYLDKSGNPYALSKHSIVKDAKWIVCVPKVIQSSAEYGPQKQRTMAMVTRVDIPLLKSAAPHLVKMRWGKTEFNGMALN